LGDTHVNSIFQQGIDKDDISETEKFLLYGMSDDDLNNKHSAQRGLLYYTNKIVQNEGKNIDDISNAINPKTKNYGVNEFGETIYKGSSECRSYTVDYQYDSSDKFIRFIGNSNNNSVLKESVMPRLTYKSNDKGDETRRTMLSIENLAYFENKTTPKNIPAYEVGPLGGRIMWFMPYALSYSDSTSVSWEAKDIIGRIEKMYSYNGMDRRCNLSFMLVIDYPPHLNNIAAQDSYKKQLSTFIQGCGINEIETKKKKEKIETIIKKENTINNIPQFQKPSISHYFENDKDNVENSLIIQYEVNSGFKLNKDFINDTDNLIEYMIQQISQGNKITMNITSQASSLYESNYNAGLSFRRGSSLVKYIIKQYNTNIKFASLRTSLLSPDGDGTSLLNRRFYQETDQKYNITQEDIIKRNRTVTIVCNSGKVTFIIRGSGEINSNTSNIYIDQNTLNSLKAKSERNSKIDNIKSDFDDTGTITTVTTSNITTNTETIVNDKVLETEYFNKGYDYIDYTSEYLSNKFVKNNAFETIHEKEIRPVFHSQTPYDLVKRYIFLHQLTRPFSKEEVKNADGTTKQLMGSNSIFGRMPVIVLRIGDFLNTKALVNSLSFSFDDSTWDFNPEGMGAIPMFCKVSMDLTFVGGQSLESPIDILQTANDYNFIAPSTYTDSDDKQNFYNINKPQFVKSTIQVGKQKKINDNYLNKLKTT